MFNLLFSRTDIRLEYKCPDLQILGYNVKKTIVWIDFHGFMHRLESTDPLDKAGVLAKEVKGPLTYMCRAFNIAGPALLAEKRLLWVARLADSTTHPTIMHRRPYSSASMHYTSAA